MHTAELVFATRWASFWIYWLVAAFPMKKGRRLLHLALGRVMPNLTRATLSPLVRAPGRWAMRASTVTAFVAALALAAALSVVPLQVAGAQSSNTSVLIPSSGETLSGSTYLDASATNETSVEFLLFGGTYGYSAPVVCTATATYYGWLCSWNTTDVPDGSYVLVSEASGAGGSAFSSGVSITVDNPPPSTTVVLPQADGTLDSAQTNVLDAVASPGVTQVSIVLTVAGETIPMTATPTIYGWIVVLPANQPCNPQTTPDCRTESASASIQSVASYSGGVTGTSPPVPATIIIYQLVG